jgi:hypothetical protein
MHNKHGRLSFCTYLSRTQCDCGHVLEPQKHVDIIERLSRVVRCLYITVIGKLQGVEGLHVIPSGGGRYRSDTTVMSWYPHRSAERARSLTIGP